MPTSQRLWIVRLETADGSMEESTILQVLRSSCLLARASPTFTAAEGASLYVQVGEPLEVEAYKGDSELLLCGRWLLAEGDCKVHGQAVDIPIPE